GTGPAGRPAALRGAARARSSCRARRGTNGRRRAAWRAAAQGAGRGPTVATRLAPAAVCWPSTAADTGTAAAEDTDTAAGPAAAEADRDTDTGTADSRPGRSRAANRPARRRWRRWMVARGRASAQAGLEARVPASRRRRP